MWIAVSECRKQVKGARWENQVRALSWTTNHMIQQPSDRGSATFFGPWKRGVDWVRKGRQSWKEKFHDIIRTSTWKTSLARPVPVPYLDWLCSSNVIFLGVNLKSALESRTGIEGPKGSERVSSGKSWPQSWLYLTGQESILLHTGTCSNACVWWNQAVSTCYSVGVESDLTLYFCFSCLYI